MAAPEARLQAEILLRWGAHPNVVLWRSNAGQAWVKASGGRMRPIQVNVPGCPDNIGWVEVPLAKLLELIGPDGSVAVFLGIEDKAPRGVVRESQALFRARLKRNRGIYLLARSVDDVDEVLVPLVGEPPGGTR